MIFRLSISFMIDNDVNAIDIICRMFLVVVGPSLFILLFKLFVFDIISKV